MIKIILNTSSTITSYPLKRCAHMCDYTGQGHWFHPLWCTMFPSQTLTYIVQHSAYSRYRSVNLCELTDMPTGSRCESSQETGQLIVLLLAPIIVSQSELVSLTLQHYGDHQPGSHFSHPSPSHSHSHLSGCSDQK